MIRVRFHIRGGAFVEGGISRADFADMSLPGCTITLHGSKSFKLNGNHVLYVEEIIE